MNDLIKNSITSMEVAEMVGKKHSDLLKDIRRYVNQLAEGKIPSGDFFNVLPGHKERLRVYRP